MSSDGPSDRRPRGNAETDPERPVRRRRLLRAVGGGSVLVVAGCTEEATDASPTPTDIADEPSDATATAASGATESDPTDDGGGRADDYGDWPGDDCDLRTYQVSGGFSGLCDALESQGPSADGGDFAGHVETDVNIAPDASTRQQRRSGNAGGTGGDCLCEVRIDSFDVTLECTVVMPVWSDYEDASDDERARWNDFLEALKTHEAGHVAIGRRTAERIRERLEDDYVGRTNRETAPTCREACQQAFDQIRRNYLGDIQPIEEDATQDHQDYDDRTDHGDTQGATLEC